MNIFLKFRKITFFISLTILIFSCENLTDNKNDTDTQTNIGTQAETGTNTETNTDTQGLISLCGDSNSEVSITDYSINNKKLIMNDSAFPAYYIGDLPSSEVVSITDFYINIHSAFESIAKKINTEKPKPSFSFIRKAHACSPLPTYTNQLVSSFKIVSNQNIGDIPAGDSLNGLFNFFKDNYEATSAITIESYNTFKIDEYLAFNEEAPISFYLNFLGEVESGSTHTFQVNMELDTGEMFELFTNPVTFE